MGDGAPGMNVGEGLGRIRRKAVSVSQERLIREECPGDGTSLLPLRVEPAVAELNLERWAKENREYIESKLHKHGAILFRGFNLPSVSHFENFVNAVTDDVMEYRERSSPRSRIKDKVYTSTDYPPDQRIFLHNEHSYSKTFPLRLFFYCARAAREGGETPLADTRRVLRRIDPKIRQRFLEKRWMYVRNFGDGFGLSWQTVFQTTDRASVEEYCRRAGVECVWKEGDRLMTRQVRPAFASHPRTGEELWFNHVTFFHVSTLEPGVRDALQAAFAEADLPNNTYYGDGSRIEASVMDELREAYVSETVTFPWREGDVVILDNMLTAHGRAPFVGPRMIMFSMASPHTRRDA